MLSPACSRLGRRLLAAVTAVILSTAGLVTAVVIAPPAHAATSTFHIEGGGFGHGIGMSQYGAHGMAHAGSTYQAILTHYYTGTAITPLTQPTGLRIWLALDPGPNPGTTVTPSGDTQFRLDGPGGQQVATASSGQSVRVNVVNGLFHVLVNGTDATPSGVGGGGHNLYAVYPQAGPLRLDKTGNRYKYGDLELSITAGGLRIVVENMTMQQYLYGLGEVPSSWETEALRAQAVAGRTYAKEKIDRLGENRSDCGCGLFGTTTDQNYVGFEKEAGASGASWVAAVNDTDTQVVTYQGSVIQAFYFSSSGGYTENSENVFVQALPYLRGVPDAPDSYQNPNFHWTRDYSHDQMQRWVDAASDTNVGTLDHIDFLPPFGVSGRVIKVVDANNGGVRIVGSAGTKRVSGDRFESVVNSGISADGGGLSTMLLSTLLNVGGFDAYVPGFAGGVYVAATRNSGGGGQVVTGAGPGGGPDVRVFNVDGTLSGAFFAYDSGFRGGVRVAACDLTGDGTSEIVTAPGPGGGPNIRVFRTDGTLLSSFFAYDAGFRGGVYLGCADVTGEGQNDIITGPGAGGGPDVRAFSAGGSLVRPPFFAYDSHFTGGVRVAAARIDGPSSRASIFVGAGPGGGPDVRVFSAEGFLRNAFFAYDAGFTGGVYVAGGDVNGDGFEDIITGAGDSGGSHVRMFGLNGTDVRTGFIAFQTGNDHGARVGFGMLPGPTVVASEGNGSPPLVRLFPF